MPIKCCEGFNQQIYPQVDSWKKRSAISRLREISRFDRQAGMLAMLRTKYLSACQTWVFESETPVRKKRARASTDFDDFMHVDKAAHIGNVQGGSGEIWAALPPLQPNHPESGRLPACIFPEGGCVCYVFAK
jgi:hypothetical protein